MTGSPTGRVTKSKPNIQVIVDHTPEVEAIRDAVAPGFISNRVSHSGTNQGQVSKRKRSPKRKAKELAEAYGMSSQRNWWPVLRRLTPQAFDFALTTTSALPWVSVIRSNTKRLTLEYAQSREQQP